MHKRYYQVGWKGILLAYPKNNFWQLITFVLIEFSGTDILALIKRVISYSLSITPIILGFSVAGFAAFIGISASSRSVFMRVKGEVSSYIQKVSATFCVMILALTISTIFGIIGDVSIALLTVDSFPNNCIESTLKWGYLFISLFLFYYSFFTLTDVSKTLFNTIQITQSEVDIREQEQKKG